jgi:hypothetical protein
MAALQCNVQYRTGTGQVSKQYWNNKQKMDILQQCSGTQNGQWVLFDTLLIYQILK